mmetsp:Transcript_3701/g.11409  ORF Transcript_3701/g.11409 Transcript_3701/m.11409 type:complete len:230 (+) Transcript_3701:1814-2503(+)
MTRQSPSPWTPCARPCVPILAFALWAWLTTALATRVPPPSPSPPSTRRPSPLSTFGPTESPSLALPRYARPLKRAAAWRFLSSHPHVMETPPAASPSPRHVPPSVPPFLIALAWATRARRELPPARPPPQPQSPPVSVARQAQAPAWVGGSPQCPWRRRSYVWTYGLMRRSTRLWPRARGSTITMSRRLCCSILGSYELPPPPLPQAWTETQVPRRAPGWCRRLTCRER